MAKGTTADERREAVTILPGGDYNPEDDISDAFEGWRNATDETQIPGKVSAWQIPMDDRGVPQPTAKHQIRLGAWPIDAYKFDDLCEMLKRDFMTPEKILCVRLIGSRSGERGTQFNRVVILRATNDEPKNNGAQQSENLSMLMKTIQESNERTLALIQRMQPQKQETDATTELQRILQLSALINKPMQDLMATLLPALIGRPAAAVTDPMAGLSGLIDVAGKLADLRGGGGGESDSDAPEWLQALKAVVPLAKPALEAIASQRPVAVLPQGRIAAQVSGPQLAPIPAGPTVAPGVSAATPTQPQAPQPAPAGTMSMGDIPSGDIQVFAQLKPQVDSLLQIAKDGGDPVAAADLLFDEMILELPDELYDKLGSMFEREKLVNQLAVFHPGVLQHREFFEKFRKQVDLRFTKEDVEAAERPTPV